MLSLSQITWSIVYGGLFGLLYACLYKHAANKIFSSMQTHLNQSTINKKNNYQQHGTFLAIFFFLIRCFFVYALFTVIYNYSSLHIITFGLFFVAVFLSFVLITSRK